jgi:hypothetical protein
MARSLVLTFAVACALLVGPPVLARLQTPPSAAAPAGTSSVSAVPDIGAGEVGSSARSGSDSVLAPSQADATATALASWMHVYAPYACGLAARPSPTDRPASTASATASASPPATKSPSPGPSPTATYVPYPWP